MADKLVSIRVDETTRTELNKLRTTTSDRDTYDEIIDWLLAGKPEPTPPAPTITGISVFPLRVTLLEGQTSDLDSFALFDDHTTKPITTAVSWSSSDESVAVVDDQGIVSARRVGDATITASFTGYTASSTLLVEALNPAPIPSPTPVPSAYPARCRLVIPSNFQFTYDKTACINEGWRWTQRIKDWIYGQVGKTFEIEYDVIETVETLEELQSAPGTMNLQDRDRCGQGVCENRIWDLFSRQGLKSESPMADIRRWWAIVLGAGGWAGGRHVSFNPNHPGANVGMALIGDWTMYPALLNGTPDPGCECLFGVGAGICNPGPTRPTWDGGTVPSLPERDFGHEIGHSIGIDPHVPYIVCPDPMSAQQKSDLLARNVDFLQ